MEMTLHCLKLLHKLALSDFFYCHSELHTRHVDAVFENQEVSIFFYDQNIIKQSSNYIVFYLQRVCHQFEHIEHNTL